MKKLVLLLAVALVSVSAFAVRPTGLNIGGGYAMDFYRSSGTTGLVGTPAMIVDDNNFYGAFVEVGYDLKVAKHSKVYFGARYSELFSGNFDASRYNYVMFFANRSYFDIPIKYQFNGKVGPSTKLFFTVGPTVNVWLSNAAAFSEGTSGTVISSETQRVNYWDLGIYNRMNISLGGSFGVITHHVKIYAAYDQAICNSAKSSTYSVSLGQLRVGAAYVF